MKFLRTIFGLAAIIIGLGFVLYFFSFLLYLVPFLTQALADMDLPQILLSHLVLGIGLFILGFVMAAKRKSKIASIVVGILLILLTAAGFYCDSIDTIAENNLVIEIVFMVIGFSFFLVVGIFQKGNLKTKAEKRSEQLKQQQMKNGTYVPPQAYYPQPQQTYQQPPATPLYQGPGHSQNVPVKPAPIVPPPAPVTPTEPTVASEPVVSEPTPLTETPEPVEVVPTNGWTCKLCQTANTPESKFCKNCGSPKDVQ